MIQSTRRRDQTALRSAVMSGNKHVFEAILGVSVGKLPPLEVGLGRHRTSFQPYVCRMSCDVFC